MARDAQTDTEVVPVRLLGAVWLGAFLVSLDYTALNVALPTLATDFGVGTSRVSWIVIGYMLSLTSLTPLAGHVINRCGHVRALSVALVVFAAASLASALAPDLRVLVGMRTLQGIGASVLYVIGPFVVRTATTEDVRDRAFALYATAPTAGLCTGPAIGGLLTDCFGWRAVFLVNLPMAALAFALLRWAARTAPAAAQRPRAPAPTPDLATAALGTAGLAMLLVALDQGQEWGWSSLPIGTLLGAATVALVAVVVRERHASHPLLDPRLFAVRDFTVSALAFLPLLVVFGGGVFLMPFYFEWLGGLRPAQVGHLLLIPPVATILAATATGFLLSGVDRRLVCLLGIVSFITGVALFASLARDASPAMQATALFVMGAGGGLYYPTLIQVGLASVPSELAAQAASLQSGVRVLGQMLGVVVFESILSHADPSVLDAAGRSLASTGSSTLLESAFRSAFWCGSMIAALALPVACLLLRPVRSVERGAVVG
jgi:EmrB/QacA subfamily drug resistance transporter